MAADSIETSTELLPAVQLHQAEPVRRDNLKGLQKAAILLVTLGRDGASQVLKHLPEHDIEQLTLEMARLQQIPQTTTNQVFQEVDDTLVAGGAWQEGGF